MGTAKTISRDKSRRNRPYHKIGLAVIRQIGGYYFLIPIDKKAWTADSIYMVNEVGAYIWGLLDTVASREQIGKLVLKHFEGARSEDIQKDITNFLTRLETVCLISNG